MHQVKAKRLITEMILKETEGKVSIQNILAYLENFTDEELEPNDLVHKQWVLDKLTEINTANLFQGYFADETALLAYPTAGIPDGSWALVGSDTTFAHYDWDLDALGWKVITGEKGDPGTVDLGALDLRYFRKDIDDNNGDNIASFAKVILTAPEVDNENFVNYIGIKADGTLVSITPAVISGDLTREFVVSEAVTTWQIVHNMGKKPCFALKDSSGNPLYPNWDWIDNNTIEFYFDGIQSGGGVLN